jgi:hypothetical protein
MKQGNHTSRVDRGWALMQPELDKAFAPKSTKRIWPLFLFGVAIVTVTVYVLTTQIQNHTTSPSGIDNFITATRLNDNSKTSYTLKSTEPQSSGSKSKNFVLPHSESSMDEKIALAPTVKKRAATEKTVQSTLSKTYKPFLAHKSANLLNEKHSNQPNSGAQSTLPDLNTPTQATSKSLNESRLPFIALAKVAQLPALPATKLSHNTRKTIGLDKIDLNEEANNQSQPFLSAQLKSSAVYNIQDKSLATEFTGGMGMTLSAWRLGLDVGIGHRSLALNKLNTNRIDANALADDTSQNESDIPSGTTGSSTNENIRHSLPRNIDELIIDEEVKQLYALGQLSAQYNYKQWSMSGNVGLQWYQYQEQLSNPNLDNGNMELAFHPITNSRTSLFAGSEVAYAISDHMDLSLGYRRILSDTDLGKDYFTASARYTF